MPLRLKKEPIKRKPEREKNEVNDDQALLEAKNKTEVSEEKDDTAAEDLRDEGQTRAIEAITGEPVTPEDEEEALPDEPEVPEAELVTDLLPTEELPLSPEERERFITLDREVEDSFLTAARALREISKRRLYRESYPTFEDYIRDRFDFTKRLAYYYIDAANIADNLSESELKVHILPTSETQLRPLKNLSPDDQRKVWQRAVEKANGKTPSGAIVRETKEELLPLDEDGKASSSIGKGDICVIQSPTNEILSDRKGYWAIVDEVAEDGTLTLSLFDRTFVDRVSRSDLSRLRFSDKEKRDRRKLFGRLQFINEGFGETDRAVVLLMRHFGTLKAKVLTPIEEDILKLLERRSRGLGKGDEEEGTTKEERALTEDVENTNPLASPVA